MFGISPYRYGRHCNIMNFDNFFNDDLFKIQEKYFPPFYGSHNLKADIKETDDNYTLYIDAPGMTKENLTVRYEQKTLIIEGKRDYNEEVKEQNYIRRERSFGSFTRAFYFDNIDEDGISAAFEDGVLCIDLPKTKATKSTNRQIEIN